MKHYYRFFWLSHQLYVFLYLLSLVHGLARITSPPKFWIFFLVPGLVFALDKVVSLHGSYMELDILETELLPSDVIKIKFYRPPNYRFSASKSSIRRFVITEKAHTRAFSWLKAATTAFTFETLLRHYAKRALTPRSLNVTLGPQLEISISLILALA